MLHRNMEEVTRRDFLRGAGASVAGLTVVGSVGLLMKNTAFAKQPRSGQGHGKGLQ